MSISISIIRFQTFDAFFRFGSWVFELDLFGFQSFQFTISRCDSFKKKSPPCCPSLRSHRIAQTHLVHTHSRTHRLRFLRFGIETWDRESLSVPFSISISFWVSSFFQSTNLFSFSISFSVSRFRMSIFDVRFSMINLGVDRADSDGQLRLRRVMLLQSEQNFTNQVSYIYDVKKPVTYW